MTLPVFPDKIYGRSYSMLKTPEFGTQIAASDGKAETAVSLIVNPIWHFQLVFDQLFNDLTNPAFSVSELEYLMGLYCSMGGRASTFLLDDPEDDAPRGPIVAVAIAAAGAGYAVGNQLKPLGDVGTGCVLQVATVNGSGGITGLTIVSGGSYYVSQTGAQLANLSGKGAGATVNTTAAGTVQLVNDGAGNYYSPLQRNIGGLFLEDVTDLNPQDGSGLKVWANGVPQVAGTNYNLLGPGLSIPGYSFQGMYLAWIGGGGGGGFGDGGFGDTGFGDGPSGGAPATPITAAFNFYFRVRFEDDKQDFEKFLYRLWTIGGAEGQRGSGMMKLMTRKPQGV